MLIIVFSFAGFPIIDVTPQDITFTAVYFIVQVLTPLHQDRMSPSQDAAWRRFNLNFDNSRYHLA
jgi:hypothetical protein